MWIVLMDVDVVGKKIGDGGDWNGCWFGRERYLVVGEIVVDVDLVEKESWWWGRLYWMLV